MAQPPLATVLSDYEQYLKQVIQVALYNKDNLAADIEGRFSHPAPPNGYENKGRIQARERCQQEDREISNHMSSMLNVMCQNYHQINSIIQDANAFHALADYQKCQKRAQYDPVSNVANKESLKHFAQWSQTQTDKLCLLYQKTESLLEMLNTMKTYSVNYPTLEEQTMNLIAALYQLIKNMFEWTFIITDQPPLVVKNQQITISASFRILCAPLASGIGSITDHGNHKITARIISDEFAIKNYGEDVQNQIPIDLMDTSERQTSGKIISCEKKKDSKSAKGRHDCQATEYNIERVEPDGMAGIDLIRVKLDMVSRHKLGKDAIEKKNYIIFSTVIKLGDEKNVLPIQVLSMPFVYACHTDQESRVWPQILWDAAFSNGLNPVPMKGSTIVSWTDLEPVLVGAFATISGAVSRQAATVQKKQSGGSSQKTRMLTAADLKHLRIRYETGREIDSASHISIGDLISPAILNHLLDLKKNLLTFSKKDPTKIRDSEFTFWQYFYSCAEMLNPKSGYSKLFQLWDERLIYGFISKDDAQAKLIEVLSHGERSMIIRFSDSSLSGLTVSCMDAQNQVDNQKPFPFKEIVQKIGFPKIIESLKAVKDVNTVICGDGRLANKTEITNKVDKMSDETAYGEYSDPVLEFTMNKKSNIKEEAPSPSEPSNVNSRKRANPGTSSSDSYTSGASPPAISPSFTFPDGPTPGLDDEFFQAIGYATAASEGINPPVYGSQPFVYPLYDATPMESLSLDQNTRKQSPYTHFPATHYSYAN